MQLQRHHRELTDGEGKCSVPMWANGLPAGLCDEPAYGVRPEGETVQDRYGRAVRLDGRYSGYVPALACPRHGGPSKPAPPTDPPHPYLDEPVPTPEPAPGPHAAAVAAGMSAVEKALESPTICREPEGLAGEFLPPTAEQHIAYLESEVERLRGIVQSQAFLQECARTPLMRDVLAERDNLAALVHRNSEQVDELADALETILRETWSADDTRLLAVGLFGSKVDADTHARCDRLKAAHAAGREALRKAGRS